MKTAMPVPFEDKTIDYYCTDENLVKQHPVSDWKKPRGGQLRGKTNPVTWQFMKNKYVVIRDFIPQEMITFAMDVWKSAEYKGEDTALETHDITYKNPLSSRGTSSGKYCSPWGNALSHFIHEKLKDVFDMNLIETYSFTRKYSRGSYLGSHTDRPSCEVSATLCLDYKSDDGSPWTIWVRNDKNYAGVDAEIVKNESQDYTHRERLRNSCIPVDLEPGDILLYQGPNIPHWRDEFLGDYSYHIFSHFVNRDSKMQEIDGFNYGEKNLKTSLELDGRASRWSDCNTERDEAHDFNDKYYATDYGQYVNNYDDLVEIESKKK